MAAFVPSQSDWATFVRQQTQMQTAIEALQNQLASVQNQVDQYGNTIVIIGNLNQTLLIGASATQTGVYVGTALTGPGIAWRENTQATTITTTANSTTATVGSGSGLSNGMVIASAQLNGSSVVVPGTTFTISGTTVTLSIAAAQSSSVIYCVACNWYPLTALTVP